MATIIESFQQYLQSGDIASCKELLSQNPELAQSSTDKGVSLVLLCAYYRQMDLAQHIASLKKDLSIYEAAAVGDMAKFKKELDNNKDLLNAFAADGFTPLGLSCFFGQEEIVAFLIKEGAEINLAANNDFKVYPLHSAVASQHLGITRLLLENGADANVSQMKGVKAIHSAARNGQIEMVKLLLDYEVDSNAEMEDGNRAIDLAKAANQEEVVQFLSSF